MSATRASIVVASRDRPELLDRLVEGLRPQLERFAESVELIIVDDGSVPAYDPDRYVPARCFASGGVGPARARNLGVQHATGDVILFTDDDVTVAEDWVTEALHFLDEHPECAGVTGDTTSPPYNPLYEHSVEDHDGGSYLTCNSAYRRAAFVQVGGFDRLFPHAAHEDRDLAFRVARDVGPIGFHPAMRVVHPGRAFSARRYWKRGHLAPDDWLLFSRYPNIAGDRVGKQWAPLKGALRTWWNAARRGGAWKNPRHFVRWLVVASGQLAVTTIVSFRLWRRVRDRDTRPVPGLLFPGYRIAYVGPPPDPTAGGAPGVAGMLLAAMLERGHSVDVFVVAGVEDDNPVALGAREGLRVVVEPTSFRFERWYSRTNLTKMISSQVFNALGKRRLARTVAAYHRTSPYDFVYQFSTFESIGVPRVNDLPVLIHPSVHAAGERRWLRIEGAAGLSSDGTLKRRVVSAWLAMRAWRQRRDAQRATGVLALSHAFADLVVQDYGLAPEKIRVVPNCIDLAAIPMQSTRGSTVLSVGRLVVRKGLEHVVGASHLIAQRIGNGLLPNDVRIRVLGGHSLWSDYRGLVDRADSSVLSSSGRVSRADVIRELDGALALVQVSAYEPFGLTVAESLAAGVPVIVTAAVGAAEGLSADVAHVVGTGPENVADEIANVVTTLIHRPDSVYQRDRAACRAEAEQRFAPAVVARQLEEAVGELLTGT